MNAQLNRLRSTASSSFYHRLLMGDPLGPRHMAKDAGSSKNKVAPVPLFILLLVCTFVLLPRYALGAEEDGIKEVGVTNGWREFRFENIGAVGTPIWCGGTGKIIVPLRGDRLQIVDVKRRTISYLDRNNYRGRLHCSNDGRYIFFSTTSRSELENYSLRYYDTQTNKFYTIFDEKRSLRILIESELISPHGRYLIGPTSLGDRVVLAGGEQVKVISADTLPIKDVMETLLWTKDDKILVAARFTERDSTDLTIRVIDTASLRAKEVRNKSHIVGFTPFWLDTDGHSLYYRRSNHIDGGGDLWKVDLSAVTLKFVLWKKNVLSFHVNLAGSMIITREFGVRYQGLDTIVDKDPTRHFKTASLVRPDGREELIRKGSPLSFGAVAISQDGKM